MSHPAGIEGVVAKRKGSIYQPLLVGFYDGETLLFAGKVRAGFIPPVLTRETEAAGDRKMPVRESA